MSKSLQQVQNYYVNQGLSGDKLREALENDREYQKLLKERKSKLQASNEVSSEEANQYVLAADTDYEILSKIHQLEKQNLSATDKEFVRFIRTQLEFDWRSPILVKLDELLSKYK
ncbi:hypothetical protein HYW35_03440 [Candidatus Saccharibacteria bacterium]|nr:hypothetical protein [Candidatus Saccharibacteria bacterium]